MKIQIQHGQLYKELLHWQLLCIAPAITFLYARSIFNKYMRLINENRTIQEVQLEFRVKLQMIPSNKSIKPSNSQHRNIPPSFIIPDNPDDHLPNCNRADVHHDINHHHHYRSLQMYSFFYRTRISRHLSSPPVFQIWHLKKWEKNNFKTQDNKTHQVELGINYKLPHSNTGGDC